MMRKFYQAAYGFKLAHFHPAQPVFPVHFGYGAGADQVGDKAHDFG